MGRAAACPVKPQGWDNRTFRLGSDLAVRIPSTRGYDAQVEKEHRWLPVLAEVLPLPIPKPVAKGAPGPLFDGPWPVYSWYPRQTLNRAGAREADLAAVALSDAENPADGWHAGRSRDAARGRVRDDESRRRLAI